MTFKEAFSKKCEEYAHNYASARFIGYNTAFGSKMYGTLEGVESKQLLETPVSENLMVGLAMGLSFEGYRPVVCFERHDFMLLALDALVNHVDKMPWISGGQFKFPIVVRAIVGSGQPIDPGPMHRQNYALALKVMLKYTDVEVPCSMEGLDKAWNKVGKTESGAVVIVEYKDDYAREIPESL